MVVYSLTLTVGSAARRALGDAALVCLCYRSGGDGEGEAHGEEGAWDMHGEGEMEVRVCGSGCEANGSPERGCDLVCTTNAELSYLICSSSRWQTRLRGPDGRNVVWSFLLRQVIHRAET